MGSQSEITPGVSSVKLEAPDKLDKGDSRSEFGSHSSPLLGESKLPTPEVPDSSVEHWEWWLDWDIFRTAASLSDPL